MSLSTKSDFGDRAEYIRKQKRERYANRSEEKKAADMDYRRSRREQKKIYTKEYRARPETIIKERAQAEAWYKNNPGRRKAIDSETYSRNSTKRKAQALSWSRAHPECVKLSVDQWRKANPNKVAAMSIESCSRRRAWKTGNGAFDPDTLPFTEIVQLIASYRCPYCETWHDVIPVIDHIEALSNGGPHQLTNLTICCSPCNGSKGSKTLMEFADFRNIKSSDSLERLFLAYNLTPDFCQQQKQQEGRPAKPNGE